MIVKDIIAKLPKKDIFYLSVILLFGVFLLRGCSYEENLKEELQTTNTLHDIINDSLTSYKNKDSLWEAQSKVLVGTVQTIKREYNKKYQFQNAEIDRLVSMINKHTKSAVVVNTVTNYSGVAKVEYVTDTVHHFDSTYIERSIVVNHKDEWIALSLEANKDTASFDLSVINKYDINIEREKFNAFQPFKKRETMVKVTNLNPYTQTTALESFIPIKEKKKYRGVKYGIAIGLGFILGVRVMQ